MSLHSTEGYNGTSSAMLASYTLRGHAFIHIRVTRDSAAAEGCQKSSSSVEYTAVERLLKVEARARRHTRADALAQRRAYNRVTALLALAYCYY